MTPAHRRFLFLGLAAASLTWPHPLRAKAADADVAPLLESRVLFTPKDLPDGISVPLPSILVTRRGTAIAVCELRKRSKTGFNDFGHESDIVIRRSKDSGRTWGPVQVAYADPEVNAVNGPIVEDAATGRILLTFTEVPADVTTQAGWVESMARIGGSLWTIASDDDGATWSKPVETRPAGRDHWIAWPGNNSHGVQVAGGRLVVAGMAHRIRPGEVFRALDLASCLLFSDDHGAHWRIGATSFYGTDELALAACGDGSILASIRLNNRSPHDLVRLMARSRDRGETFAETWMQGEMSIAHCHAGMLQWVDRSRGEARHILAHCGPQGGSGAGNDHPDRTRLTIRLSYDDGRTWPVSRLLLPDGRSTEYCDLALAPDGNILCLFTGHQHSPDGTVELLRFTLPEVEEEYSPLSN